VAAPGDAEATAPDAEALHIAMTIANAVARLRVMTLVGRFTTDMMNQHVRVA